MSRIIAGISCETHRLVPRLAQAKSGSSMGRRFSRGPAMKTSRPRPSRISASGTRRFRDLDSSQWTAYRAQDSKIPTSKRARSSQYPHSLHLHRPPPHLPLQRRAEHLEDEYVLEEAPVVPVRPPGDQATVRKPVG